MITATEALRRLQEGNRRFVANRSATEPLDAGVDRALDARLIADVALEGKGFLALPLQQGDRLLRRFQSEVGDRHRRSLAGHPQGTLSADRTAGARDQTDLADEPPRKPIRCAH